MSCMSDKLITDSPILFESGTLESGIWSGDKVEGTILRYFGSYPCSNGLSQLPLGYMALAARNINWRLWNMSGPRQCV